MDTIKLFRVEKLRRAVRVVLTDGRRLDGDVFLAERTKIRAEPQEPIDLLNEDAPFFPFYLSEQELLLVAKSQVTRVETVAPESDPSADMPDGAMAVEIMHSPRRRRDARHARAVHFVFVSPRGVWVRREPVGAVVTDLDVRLRVH